MRAEDPTICREYMNRTVGALLVETNTDSGPFKVWTGYRHLLQPLHCSAMLTILYTMPNRM